MCIRDRDSARAYAKIAKKITGEAPVVILSDDPRASKKIEAFDKGTQRMAICVRMVSEGVDIVRACALGFLTSYRTPLFFAQAVGRVVRARATHETATVFLPAVRPLLELAARLEEERNHIVRLAGPADAGWVRPAQLLACFALLFTTLGGLVFAATLED